MHTSIADSRTDLFYGDDNIDGLPTVVDILLVLLMSVAILLSNDKIQAVASV